jgi:hypothetical protein
LSKDETRLGKLTRRAKVVSTLVVCAMLLVASLSIARYYGWSWLPWADSSVTAAVVGMIIVLAIPIVLTAVLVIFNDSVRIAVLGSTRGENSSAFLKATGGGIAILVALVAVFGVTFTVQVNADRADADLAMERWKDTHTTLETKFREATASLASPASAVRAAGLLSLAAVADEWLAVGSDFDAGSSEARQASAQTELAINTFLAYLRKPIPLADGSLPDKPTVALPGGYLSSAYLDDEGDYYLSEEVTWRTGSYTWTTTSDPWLTTYDPWPSMSDEWWTTISGTETSTNTRIGLHEVTVADQLAWRTQTLDSWRARWESASLGTDVEWERWVAAWNGHVPDQLEPFVVEPDPATPGEVRIANMVGLEDLDPEERWVRTVAAQILNEHVQGRCVWDFDQTGAFPQLPSMLVPLATDGSGEFQYIAKTLKGHYLRPLDGEAGDWSPYVTDLSNTYFTDLVLAPESGSARGTPRQVFSSAVEAVWSADSAAQAVPWTEEQFDQELARAEAEPFVCVVLGGPAPEANSNRSSRQKMNLAGITVYGSLQVERASVGADMSLDDSLVSQSLALTETTVWGELTATGLAAGGSLSLDYTTVKGDLRLDVALAGDISLYRAIVRGDVGLTGSSVSVDADSLNVEGKLVIYDALILNGTYLGETVLQGGLSLDAAVLGGLSLRSSAIGGIARMGDHVLIGGEAHFAGASFADGWTLRGVLFVGKVCWSDSFGPGGGCSSAGISGGGEITWPREGDTTVDVLQSGHLWGDRSPPRLADGGKMYVDEACVLTNNSGAPMTFPELLASC